MLYVNLFTVSVLMCHVNVITQRILDSLPKHFAFVIFLDVIFPCYAQTVFITFVNIGSSFDIQYRGALGSSVSILPSSLKGRVGCK